MILRQDADAAFWDLYDVHFNKKMTRSALDDAAERQLPTRTLQPAAESGTQLFSEIQGSTSRPIPSSSSNSWIPSRERAA